MHAGVNEGAVTARILPLPASPRQHDEEPDSFIVAKPFPRIEPGLYDALSVSVRRRRAFKRNYIEAMFDVFSGAVAAGQIVGRVPAFFRLTGRTLAPSSSLARWVQLLNGSGRRDRIPLRILEDKLWKVEVRDVLVSHEKGLDGKPRPLPPSLVYSRVSAVLERLA